MSAGNSVLFDVPGPRARARHRTISWIGVAVLLLLLAGFVYRMYAYDQLSYDLWEPFVTPDYIVALLKGVLATLEAAAAAIVGAAVFGTVFGLGKLSDHAWVRWPSWVVVEFFRAVPVLVLIIFIFLTYGQGDGIGPFWSLVVGLTLYNGSVVAEILRAGIESVPRGQSEAAYAIGMRKTQVMREILLPQAVKTMLPSLISQFVVALKDTSLGYVITATSVSYVMKQIWTEFSNQLPAALLLAAIYILLNIAVAWVLTKLQERFVGQSRAVPATSGDAGA